MSDKNSQNYVAVQNAMSIFRQLTVNGKVNHKALLDEMEQRNGGPLPKKTQRTLAKMVKIYEKSLVQS